MKPIDSARPIAPQRVTPLQPATQAGRTARGADDGVTSTAAQLSAAGEAPIDTARVVAIRDAIRRGEYSIEPDAIADAMIAAGHVKRDI